MKMQLLNKVINLHTQKENVITSKVIQAFTTTKKIKTDLNQEITSLKNELAKFKESQIFLERKEVSLEDFYNIFSNESKCLSILDNVKWNEGFKCVKCKKDKFSVTDSKFSRRCTACNYLESVTVNTLFHRLRFPIQKAFFMLYIIVEREENITIDELQNLMELRRATCWIFKKKVTTALLELKKNTKFNIKWEELILINPKLNVK